MLKKYRIATLFLLAVLLCAAGCGVVDGAKISVMLAECEGVTVTSPNPVRVAAGGDAVFTAEIAENYAVAESAGVTYDPEAGTLTVSDVRYPRTVAVSAFPTDGRTYSLRVAQAEGGRAAASVTDGMYPQGMPFTLDASADEGYIFEGWSKNAPFSQGGTIVSFYPDVSLQLKEDLTLCANFSPIAEKEARTRYILYNANGGTYAETGKPFVTKEYDTSVYPCPNCLPAKDYFTREGYQLIEYNTKADGTGEAYSLGAKVLLPADKSETLTLFCIWSKETPAGDFTYKVSGNGVTVTKCASKDKTVTVPARIEGKAVTKIESKAFENLNAETLIFPNTVTSIGKNAVYNCANLTTFYLCDNVMTVDDTAISGKNSFHNFRLNAAMTPKYCDTVEGNFARKWERLATAKQAGEKVIVVMSGSSSLNGLDTPMMQEAFNSEYTVVNFGTNAGNCGVLYMEFVSHFMGEGDILIDAPEMGGDQAGNMNVTWKFFRGLEMQCNVWRYVDIANYKKLFSSLAEHNKTRAPMADKDYTQVSTGMDANGDLQDPARAVLNKPDYCAGSKFSLGTNIFAGNAAKNLNWVYALLQKKGVTVYFSNAPFNANSLTAAAKTEQAQNAYNDSIVKNLKVPVISKVQDYIIKGEWMYNSDYHPNDFGREYRTKNLIRDLKAQMVKDGIWRE